MQKIKDSLCSGRLTEIIILFLQNLYKKNYNYANYVLYYIAWVGNDD